MYPEVTQEQVEELVVDWQRRLRLSDWNVDVELVDFLEDFGVNVSDRRYKTATIKICTPRTLGPKHTNSVRDIEVTVCHELLHLHGRGFDHLMANGSLEEEALETMIELTAIALVESKRGETVE